MVQSKLLQRKKPTPYQLPPPDDVVFWSHALLAQVIDDRGLSTSELELAVNHILSADNMVKVVARVGDNMFLLRCPTTQDRDDLVELESVVIMGVMLVMKRCDPHVDLKEWRVTHAPLWVQVRGVPGEHFNKQVAAGLGGLVGQVDEVDLERGRKRGVMRVKVRVEVDRPVLPGACLHVGEKEEEGDCEVCWVSFQYENVCRLCKKCWRLGHLAESCLVDDKSTARGNIHANLPVFSVRSHVNKS